MTCFVLPSRMAHSLSWAISRLCSQVRAANEEDGDVR